MVPVLAVVGRPNVGKSTLFNRLTRSRDALVANLPGLTRDRQYGRAQIGERELILIDTGGVTGEEEGIDSAMAAQSMLAVEEADAVLFVLDARAGLTGVDEQLAQHLRMSGKSVFHVVNKIDGVDPSLAAAEFYQLGVEEIYPITATQGRGVNYLIESVLDALPEAAAEVEDESAQRGTRIAVVGRPNVGKSTLVNRMLGEERVVVYDQPGTTRDSIYIDYQRGDKPYTLIDTAGVRRRKNVRETVEKFSIVKTLKAITDANVVILLMDASEGIVDQDLHLLGQVIESGRALVLAMNKWDGLDTDHKARVRSELDRRLKFVDYAEQHFISALHGTGVGTLYKAIDAAFAAATEKFSTPAADPHPRGRGGGSPAAVGQWPAYQTALCPYRGPQPAYCGGARQSDRQAARQLQALSGAGISATVAAVGHTLADRAAQFRESLCGAQKHPDLSPGVAEETPDEICQKEGCQESARGSSRMQKSDLDSHKRDLNSPERIAEFVEAFYGKLLVDERLAAIFLDVAAIDIREHFPRIRAYWEKLLLGHDNYSRHTMNIHREPARQTRPGCGGTFDRWLQLFTDTVDEHFRGERAERAKLVAARIAGNMRKSLLDD